MSNDSGNRKQSGEDRSTIESKKVDCDQIFL
jgi:hypothetical protein